MLRGDKKGCSVQKEGEQLNDTHTTVFIPRRITTYTLNWLLGFFKSKF